ncbi:MAG: hypothetical protein K2U26_03275 [Cyclobacteriaceae bacterium]|nr:hypothetical protein [Cyclobacteriaceae bacterium]
MRKYIFHLNYLFSSSLIVSVISLGLIYFIIHNWSIDGYSKLEISFMAVLPGFIFFAFTLLLNSSMEVVYLRSCANEQILPVKMIFQIIYVSFYVILIGVVLDTLYYYFIDDSIAVDFAEGLEGIIATEGKSFKEEDLKDFRSLPYLLQNVFVYGFFCIVATLIALPTGRYFYRKIFEKR